MAPTQPYCTKQFWWIEINSFRSEKELLQGCDRNPFSFVIYYADLVVCLGAHTGHLSIHDLSLITRTSKKDLRRIHLVIQRKKRRTVVRKYPPYSKDSRLPVIVGTAVEQILYSQTKKPVIVVTIQSHKIIGPSYDFTEIAAPGCALPIAGHIVQ